MIGFGMIFSKNSLNKKSIYVILLV